MAIQTIISRLHSKFSLVRENQVFICMAISTFETFVIRPVEIIPLDYSLRKHQSFNFPPEVFIGILINILPMAFKTLFIFFTEGRYISSGVLVYQGISFIDGTTCKNLITKE
jgi:hypothetical protein